ncbi:MAG: hypothetical protein N4A68_17065 [Maledivibacter sp.]|jgi:hypothetical protein|nr:hypothetical protein [Maledivibacter sp.]
MSDNCVRDKFKIEYFERVSVYRYYHKGQLMELNSSFEIITLNISFEGLEIITDKQFSEEDILLLNIRVDGIPFDKVLGKVKCINKIGEMYKICLEFIGIPNFLFEKLKSIKNNEE